jgi:hydrogenase maturation protease
MTEDVVVGVGNPTMSDDGIGHRVIDALADRTDLADVALQRTATASFLALEALSGADRAVIVDAVSESDAEPGTIHTYGFREGAFDGDVPDVLMHDMSFSEALQAGEAVYDIPPDLLVVGVEPADLTVGVDLSEPVAAAVPDAVATVLAHLAREDETTETDADAAPANDPTLHSAEGNS